MSSTAKDHLRTSFDVIRMATIRIGELNRSRSEDDCFDVELDSAIAEHEDQLKHAETVRFMCALRVLQDEADSRAEELLELRARVRELTESITGFQRMEFESAGVVQTPELSRKVSAALLSNLEDAPLDSPSIAAAACVWKQRFECLLSDPSASSR